MRAACLGIIAGLAASLSLVGCSAGGHTLDDASALKRAVTKQAAVAGSSQVVQLELTDRPGAQDALISVRRQDGSIVDIRLNDKEASQGPQTNPTEGLAAEQLPYDQLVEALRQAGQECGEQTGGRVVFAATPTGKPMVVARCAGNAKAIFTILDGQRLSEEQGFSGAESYDRLLAEARLVFGNRLQNYGIHFGDGGAAAAAFPYLSVIGPQYEAAGGPCTIGYQRSPAALDYLAQCMAADGYELQKLDIAEVTGATMQAAHDKALGQLGGVDAKVAEVEIIAAGTELRLRVTAPDGTNVSEPL